MPVIAEEKIVCIYSNYTKQCPLCSFMLNYGQFEESCNHLMEAHDLKCLHVGQESGQSSDGPWANTVAVFGK
jgi:hypothetical protein